MKKIISMICALAMCATLAISSASAMTLDSDSYYLSELPSASAVKAREPKIVLSAEKVDSKDTVKTDYPSIPTAKRNALFNTNNWAGKTTADVYILTVSISDIGELGCGYDENDDSKIGLNINDIVMTLDNSSDFLFGNIGYFPVSGGSVAVPGNDDSIINVDLGNPASVDFAYPAYDTDENGSIIENTTVNAYIGMVLKSGTSFNFAPGTAYISYNLYSNAESDYVTNIVIPVAVEDIIIGEVAEDDTAAPSYFAANFTVGPKYNASTGIKFQFSKVEGENTTTVYADAAKSSFTGTTTFEANANVSLGVKVNDVPSNVTLTLTGADWYE